MSFSGRSLLDVDWLPPELVELLFRRARQFRDHGFPFRANATKASTSGPLIALLFFEPSTRTQMSFAIAAQRLDIGCVIFANPLTSSMVKGESLTDTVLNLEAMGPDAIIARFGEDKPVTKLLEKISVPVISAGQGICAHPTQALLDAFTIDELRGRNGHIEGEKVLIVGDVAHSRVAASNLKLLKILGAKVGLCGPEAWLKVPALDAGVELFSDLPTGLRWANVVMALRIQFERMPDGEHMLTVEEYQRKFGLNSKSLANLAPDGLIFHPGPVNQGVELESEVFQDPRCAILRQVKNGIFVRAALLYETLLT